MTIRMVDGQPMQEINVRPDGSHVLPPLPQSLASLLHDMTVVERRYLVARGFGQECAENEHAFAPWLTGIYGGRQLALLMCTGCETVQVRDVSVDRLTGASPGRGGWKRGNELMGWYTGKRRAGRVHL